MKSDDRKQRQAGLKSKIVKVRLALADIEIEAAKLLAQSNLPKPQLAKTKADAIAGRRLGSALLADLQDELHGVKV